MNKKVIKCLKKWFC